MSKAIKIKTPDVLRPLPSLLCKLGSIIIHAEEATGENGHQLDITAMKSLLNDTDVKNWLTGMDELALLPKKRTP